MGPQQVFLNKEPKIKWTCKKNVQIIKYQFTGSEMSCTTLKIIIDPIKLLLL